MLEQLIHLDQTITLALNGSSSVVLDHIILFITYTVTWIPMGLFMLIMVYKKMGKRQFLVILLGICACVFVADAISSGIFKPMVERFRPTRDPMLMHTVEVVEGYRGGKYGFFSSHAANTMSVAIFISCIFRNKALTGLLILWSLLNCWSRIYLGVHFVGDVTVGILFGIAVGMMVYYIYKRYFYTPMRMDCSPITTAILATYVLIAFSAPIFAV